MPLSGAIGGAVFLCAMVGFLVTYRRKQARYPLPTHPPTYLPACLLTYVRGREYMYQVLRRTKTACAMRGAQGAVTWDGGSREEEGREEGGVRPPEDIHIQALNPVSGVQGSRFTVMGSGVQGSGFMDKSFKRLFRV
eukprot:2059627-Rhodomonas_salina.1